MSPRAFRASFAVRAVAAVRALGKLARTKRTKSVSLIDGIAASVSMWSASRLPPFAEVPGMRRLASSARARSSVWFNESIRSATAPAPFTSQLVGG